MHKVDNLAVGVSALKKHRASSFGLGLGLALMLGLGIASALMMAADAPPIVGGWEGTLDPGAQSK